MDPKFDFTVFGEGVEVVISSKSTNNSFCMIIQTSPPGGGPPPHLHEREDELFTVLEGEYELFDGQQWNKLPKGAYGSALRGKPHTFRNCGSTPGRLICIAIPGGLDEYLRTISPLEMPRDAERLTEISNGCGIKFMTPEPPHSAPI